MARSDDKQIIFSMYRVSRTHPPHRQVLKDISLSFFYGAKIGVIGLNGAGKSSLLKIIAGIDNDFIGEVIPARDYSIGFLEQEPQLDPTKTVKEVISESVQPVLDLLAEFDRVNEGFAEHSVAGEFLQRAHGDSGRMHVHQKITLQANRPFFHKRESGICLHVRLFHRGKQKIDTA